MEQLIEEIEAYSAAAEIKPQRLLRDVINASGGQWSRWKSGKSSPTMKSADHIRAFMAEHPPETYFDRKRGAG